MYKIYSTQQKYPINNGEDRASLHSFNISKPTCKQGRQRSGENYYSPTDFHCGDSNFMNTPVQHGRRVMGNGNNKISSRKLGSPARQRMFSSSNNGSSGQLHVEHLENNGHSLPNIKDRLAPQTSKSSSLLLREPRPTNVRRNSGDSGYHSCDKVCNNSTSSDTSSGLNISSSNSFSYGKGVVNHRTDPGEVDDGIVDLDRQNKNSAGKINSSLISQRTGESPQLLSKRSALDRHLISGKLERTTLENNRTRSYTGDRSMISRSPKTCSTDGLVGLQNLGNTCFMNSILQCLSHCKPLRDRLLNNGSLSCNSKSERKGKLFSSFSDLIKNMWSRKSDIAVSPHSFKLQIQRFSPRFVGYEQQDSQEFLRFLLDGLHEDLNQAKSRKVSRTSPDASKPGSVEELSECMWMQYKSRDLSLVTELFCGQMMSTLICTKCNHRSVTFDPFWDLSLPIPRSSSTRIYDASVTLLDCLKLFTNEEDLDGDEKPKCEKCKGRQKCRKQFKIQKFPKILVLHLKRFSGFGFRSKLQINVEFPLSHLDMSQFASDSSGLRDVKYNLFAVSNHTGSTYGGHYTAYCKHSETKDWHCFNDSRVSSLSSKSVYGPQAYVLFYEIED